MSHPTAIPNRSSAKQATLLAPPFDGWGSLSNAAIVTGGVRIGSSTREVVALPGSGQHAVKILPVNLHVALAATNDWTIITVITNLADGSRPWLLYYGLPPMLQDEWWLGGDQLQLQFEADYAGWNFVTPAGVEIWGGQGFTMARKLEVVLSKTGTTIQATANGTVFLNATTPETLSTGRIYLGAIDHAPGKSFVIESIIATCPPTEADEVRRLTLGARVQVRDADSLRSMVASNCPGLRFGTAVSVNPLAMDPLYASTLAREFNQITTENDLKFQFVQPEEGVYDFVGADIIIEFAQINEMAVHGHTLVWEEALPNWLRAKPQAQLPAIMADHIATVVGRYAGKIETWDVINEPFVEFTAAIRPSPWFAAMGRKYMKMALDAAHAADPAALLFINEWGCEAPGVKQDALYSLCVELLASGAPLHGVGLQMHEDMNADYQERADAGSVSKSELKAAISRFQSMGLLVRVSEFDVNMHKILEGTLAAQGVYFRQILEAVVETGAYGFCMWGFTDKWASNQKPYTYTPVSNALMLDQNYAAKAPYLEMKRFLQAAPCPKRESTASDSRW